MNPEKNQTNDTPVSSNVPGDGKELVEVSSPWFKLRLDDISWKTIVIVGMILVTIVLIIRG